MDHFATGGAPMRRAWVVVVVLLGVGVLALDFVPGCVGHSDGHYELTVRVVRPAGQPQAVRCEAIGKRALAEGHLDGFDKPMMPSYSALADPFDGRPLTVDVPAGYMYSPLGRVVHRWRFEAVVVIGVLPDGRRVRTIADIPDPKVAREVTVTLP